MFGMSECLARPNRSLGLSVLSSQRRRSSVHHLQHLRRGFVAVQYFAGYELLRRDKPGQDCR